MTELDEIIKDIQDRLVPLLTTYEQAIYNYIFRHTYLSGKKQTLFSTRTANIGLGSGDRTKAPSWKTRSNRLKSLEQKGCVKIVDRSNKGFLVEIVLPSEMKLLQNQEAPPEEIDVNSLDFFKDKRLLLSLLDRESSRCFYTGRKINAENCYLDHVVPQSKGGNNSYRNIVATCFDANSLKNDKTADEFARLLYKEELISLAEWKELKEKLSQLQDGKLLPKLEIVRAALNS